MNTDLNSIQEFIIYQEQNVRNNSSAVNIQNFQDLDSMLDNVDRKEDRDTLRIFAEQQCANNKDNIYSLYISGLLALRENTLNDKNILKLLETYSSTKKWNIVEFIANKILESRNNVHALKSLSYVYEERGDEENLIKTWEQIVRLDYEEADMMYKLASYKKAGDNIELALKDYKKAIERYLHQKNYPQIKDIWNTLLAEQFLDIDFYFTFVDKVERILSKAKSEELLRLFYKKINLTDKHDIIITVLKTLLRISPEDDELRDDLIEVYRKKYADNPKLEDFIKMSSLSQSWRNIQEAISDFEKHISFFPGGFVYHNKWGIGRIREATHQYLTVDFAKKRNHQIEIGMAVNSLEALPKSHFWVIKTIIPKDKLRAQILSNPMWTLRKILVSLDGADNKTIKSELVPSILSEDEWKSWSVKSRKLLNEDPHFSIKQKNSVVYVYSDVALSPKENFYNTFRQTRANKVKSKQETNPILKKVKLLRQALKSNIFEDEDGDDDSFLTILEYFASYINTASDPNEYSEEFIHSIFVCDEITKLIPSTGYHLHLHMQDFIPNMSIQTTILIIKNLKIDDYKNNFLDYIKAYRNDWKEVYLQIIPYYYTDAIIEMLEKEGEIELLQEIFQHIKKQLNDFQGIYIWLATKHYDKAWLNEIYDPFSFTCDLLRIAFFIYKDLIARTKKKEKSDLESSSAWNLKENKSNRLVKHFKDISKFLFESKRIFEFIENESEKNIVYLYSLLKTIMELIPSEIFEVRKAISQKYPNFDFKDSSEFEATLSSVVSGFLTLISSMDEKTKLLQHMREVDVPNNSKEIEKARSFGDLKENAEYKAALEHQASLHRKIGQLNKEISDARIFDKKDLDLQTVEFSTKIELENLLDNSKISYTILGPWESDPEKDIISYLSPLGQHLYTKKLHEQVDFSINDQKYSMRINKIEKGI